MSNVFKQKEFSILLFTFVTAFFSMNCSLLNDDEVPVSQHNKLLTQIKSERFENIYEESAEILKSGITKKLFVERLEKAVTKMKQVDENLEFEQSELNDVLSKAINSKFWTHSSQKIEKNDEKIEFLIQWDKENTSFKLASLSTIEPTESGKYKTYFVEREIETIE